MVFRYAGRELSGINELKDTHKGETAIICAAGTTLREYDDSWAPKEWARFAVNEAIVKLGEAADFWVLADTPIVHEYADKCPKNTVALVMRQATALVDKIPAKKCYTVDSMAEVKRFTNGYQFFSRGTVLIGAIEMARFMGFKRFFIFGLDCFRTYEAYYFDDRRPIYASESRRPPECDRVRTGVPPSVRIYVTPKLKKMIVKLREAKEAGLWKDLELWCVNSPYSQQDAIPKMTREEFLALIDVEKEKAASPGETPKEAPKKKRRGRRSKKREPEEERIETPEDEISTIDRLAEETKVEE